MTELKNQFDSRPRWRIGANLVIFLALAASIGIPYLLVDSGKGKVVADSKRIGISEAEQELVLDALEAQALAKIADSKLDRAQRETIELLVLPKLQSLRSEGINRGDLHAVVGMYRLIEQPNGLRATR